MRFYLRFQTACWRLHILPLAFFQLGADAALFELGEAFDKHDAHQVIEFVLHADGQQAVGFEGEFFAVFV